MVVICSYHSGGTRTDLALNYVEANSFRNAAGDRPGVRNILIVMTDGWSNLPAETVIAANSVKTIFHAEVGRGVRVVK